MKSRLALACAAGGLSLLAALPASFMALAQTAPASDMSTLKPAASFSSIADQKARSVALFEEASKVIEHPRCLNCHPAGDRPLQTMAMHPHQPPVTRGDGGMGVPGMMCNTCHGAVNATVVGQSPTLKSIPGNPAWHLAPIEMAWVGKSLGEICQQLKDPARNGGRDLSKIVEHMSHDSLVGWGWNPGEGREPAPGTQAEFGELIKAWVDTGAACPAG
ncbi:Isoquinoline 1-oxidoreductase subunit [Rhizobium sp. RHZ02]|uniref:Isoquinoline 1-oxidoreductase subunit n=1 Tax=Rhizobium sp. RHZ02 TaxID=2769306 RepID=UPI001785D6E2|nr:Isoquinoline 1-oxidoreductase subunit [Rhizobium sp. RHZ02]MBD9453700.1 Isoquinoline 1-oxidoreductase subunit [Rhizobium sp. RHZ02]